MLQSILLAKCAYQSSILQKKINMVSVGDIGAFIGCGVDLMTGYESVSERWSPVQSPETILLSVISMLSSPNDESPANVEAARLWREDQKEFRRRCRKNVRESLGDE